MKVANSPLLKPYTGKPAILDSNLLLLRWCASFDRNLVGNFKRLNAFQVEDVELLSETLKTFSAVKTTPHVLTEVSNLANHLPRWIKDDWAEHFSKQIQIIPEESISSASIAAGDYMWLGLTDAALVALAKTHVILTIDFPLSNSLEPQGLNVINFTNLRSLWLE
ncbi:MAG: hypothetical protein ACRD19_10155 [Terriglobia bacterium]